MTIWPPTGVCADYSTAQPMSALADTLGALARVLDGQGVPWFVFGAQAVSVRGAPRATQDVDVTIDVERPRLRDLIRELESEGLRHRFPDIAEELLADGAVLPLVHPSGMEVDLVLAASGLEALALRRATPEAIDDVVVPVAHVTDLVVMKVLAGRGKDLDDLRSLLASGDADLDEARDLLGQLERALGQSDLLPLLEEAIRELKGYR